MTEVSRMEEKSKQEGVSKGDLSIKIYRCDVLNDKKYKYFSSLQKAMDFTISDTLAYYKDKDISYSHNEYMEKSGGPHGGIVLFFNKNKDNCLYTCGYIAEIEVEE